MMIEPATAAEPPSTTIAGTLIAVSPGRRMIMAPAKPTTIALQRRIPMRSPRKKMAPIDAKIGAVNDSAVASAIGIIASP
jgi:hypothetical protein